MQRGRCQFVFSVVANKIHWRCSDFLVSRRGRLLTAGSSHTIRLWSVVSVHELKLIAQNARTGTDALSTGVTLEDEMILDAPVCSVQFDESLELVSVLSVAVCQYLVLEATGVSSAVEYLSKFFTQTPELVKNCDNWVRK